MKKSLLTSLFAVSLLCSGTYANPQAKIVLVMTDDQGWCPTGYYNHSVLKTPDLDRMAANGLRFNRFYAGAPNCSPTRDTVASKKPFFAVIWHGAQHSPFMASDKDKAAFSGLPSNDHYGHE